MPPQPCALRALQQVLPQHLQIQPPSHQVSALQTCPRALEVSKDPWWFIRPFISADESAALDRNVGYPQVPGSIQAHVYVYMYVFRRGSWWIFRDLFVTLAWWTRVRHLTEMWDIQWSPAQFRPKPREFESICISAITPSSKGSKPVFQVPVIKAKSWSTLGSAGAEADSSVAGAFDLSNDAFLAPTRAAAVPTGDNTVALATNADPAGPVTNVAASSKSSSVSGYTAGRLGARMHDCVQWGFTKQRAKKQKKEQEWHTMLELAQPKRQNAHDALTCPLSKFITTEASHGGLIALTTTTITRQHDIVSFFQRSACT